MRPIIEVEGLSKVYRIGHERRPAYGSLRDDLARLARKPVDLLLGQRFDKEELWALKDVDFCVEKGEILGIIGRNGAGKSTLLKILSRIVAPTEGRAILRGKVASLLEVGTGFHPELSGRENIYLNGAILGMRRREISRKFADIVAFAGIERFLDTPVKFYSSGMYVRLAFGVAAHLEPDVLVVDEVLAVGDADFQRKSLGKMQQVTRDEGRTVLFVSHNMMAVQSLCSRALLLEEGRVTFDGHPHQAIKTYLRTGASATVEFERARARKLTFTRLELLDALGDAKTEFDVGEQIVVRLHFDVLEGRDDVQLAIELWSDEGVCVLCTTSFDEDPARRRRVLAPGRYVATCTLDNDFLREGRYHLSISSSVPGVETLDEIENAASLELSSVVDDIKRLNQGRRGVIYKRFLWEVAHQPVGETVPR